MDKFISSDKHIFTRKVLEKIDVEVIYTSMVADNKSIFVFGGDTSGMFTPSAEVRRYDISDNRWNKRANMPHYLWGSTAQIVDGKVFVMGGGRASTYTSYNLTYNVQNDFWEEKAGLPISRKGLSSGVIDGIIYISHGYQMWGVYSVSSYCYGYNPKTDTWKQCHSPISYKAYAMSLVVDNFLYVLGGYSPDAKKGGCIKMERYSPEENIWEFMPNMPRARVGSVAVAIDSKIFVLCGSESNEDYITMDYYDTKTRNWTMSDIPTPQLISPGVAMVDNKIYLTAGIDKIGEYNTKLYEITYGGVKE